MSFSKKPDDDFEDQFEKWLREIAKLIKQDEKANQLLPANESRINRLMLFMRDNPIQQCISLQEFIYEIFLLLRDAYNGIILQEDENSFRIQLSDTDVFRLQITKCSLFDNMLWQ